MDQAAEIRLNCLGSERTPNKLRSMHNGLRSFWFLAASYEKSNVDP
jgi:hypothetical protein